MGKGFDFGSATKERVVCDESMFFYISKAKSQ